MTIFDKLIVIAILGTLGVVFYCRIMNKTLADLFREVREMFSDKTNELEGGMGL